MGIRLLVADDHEIVRKGIVTLLEEQPGWVIVAETADGREAVNRAVELKPDVIVIDISMPTLNGLEATREIVTRLPQTKVLILTMHESDALIRGVLDAGARGYILKTDAAADLIKAVNALRRDRTFFTAKIAEIVHDGGSNGNGKSNAHDKISVANRLTPRQCQVLQLLAEGKSSKEVAAVLGLSLKTAQTHRTNIMIRLNCHSVSELARYAIRNQIIQP